MYVFSWLSSLLRNAKEHILGLSRVGSAGDVEKSDMFAENSVFEESIIAEYALVINGHSLVRYSNVLHYITWSTVWMIILSSACFYFGTDACRFVKQWLCCYLLSLYLLLWLCRVFNEPLCCLGPSALLQVFINIHFLTQELLPRCALSSTHDAAAARWKCYIELWHGVASAGGWRCRMVMIGLTGVMYSMSSPCRFMLWNHSWSTSSWTWPVCVKQSSAAGSLRCRKPRW